MSKKPKQLELPFSENQQTLKILVEEMKSYAKSLGLKLTYRNRDGKEYVTFTTPKWWIGYSELRKDSEKVLNRFGFTKAYGTSGSGSEQTFRLNP